MVLERGFRAQVEVNKAERDAIELIMASATNEYQRELLQELLDKIDSAPTLPSG
jgi:hypothetical protein